ncbi:MAG: hypothetical protein ACKVOH_02305 [Chlamydiales bacterium]
MLNVRHRTLILMAGLVWFFVGIFLLSMGIHLIQKMVSHPGLLFQKNGFSLVRLLTPVLQNRGNVTTSLIICGLGIGYFKGRYVLGRTVKRQTKRIFSLPEPSHIKNIYSVGLYMLIAGMMSLGILMRFLPITPDTRGWVDVAIGTALITGALQYFRHYEKG